MTDRAQADLVVRVADNPEIDPVLDKVWGVTHAARTTGYAREDDRMILEPLQTFLVYFDAFAWGEWIDLAVINEGANDGSITLFDGVVDFTTPIPVDACLLTRCLKGGKNIPNIYSTDGTTIRIFAWGIPLVPVPF